jgi:regulator of protease activity HflC (stomatin/prohibitin superfamily)
MSSFLMVVAIVAFVISLFSETPPAIRRASKLVAGGLLLVSVFVGSFVTVATGYRGVLLQFGAVKGDLEQGPHLILPWIQSVMQIEVRTQKEVVETEGSTKDLQVARTQVAINFHPDPLKVGQLFTRVGPDFVKRIIDPAVQESTKAICARYAAQGLIQERTAVKDALDEMLTTRLAQYDLVVEPNGVSLTNFSFSDEFNKSIEEKQVAQQLALKQQYVLQQAKVEAEATVARAEGIAKANEITAKSLELQSGEKVIRMKMLEKWNGVLPSVVGGNGLMFNMSDFVPGGK